MQSYLTSLGASIGIVTMGATACLAGPLDWKVVPADAEWVIHVDVERIVKSTLLEAVSGAIDLDGKMEEMQQLGMDLREDVYSVTAYGWGKVESHDLVVVVDGSGRIAEAISKLAEHEGDIQVTEANGRTYYDAGAKGEDHVFAVMSEADGSTRVIASTTREAVDKAAERRSRDRAPVVGDGPVGGSLVFISAMDLKKMVPHNGNDPHAKLVEQSEQFQFEVSERGENIAVRMNVSIIDSERTQDVVDLMQGLLAFGRMAFRDNEEMRPIADMASHVQISSQNSQVQITLDAPADQIAKLLEHLDDHDHHQDDDRDDRGHHEDDDHEDRD